MNPCFPQLLVLVVKYSTMHLSRRTRSQDFISPVDSRTRSLSYHGAQLIVYSDVATKLPEKRIGIFAPHARTRDSNIEVVLQRTFQQCVLGGCWNMIYVCKAALMGVSKD